MSRRDKAGYEKKGFEGERRRGNNFSLCDQREILSGVISLSFSTPFKSHVQPHKV